MTKYITENDRRRAVVNGLVLKLFRNTGIKHAHWTPVWPDIEGDMRTLKRWAKAWSEKGRMPKTVH